MLQKSYPFPLMKLKNSHPDVILFEKLDNKLSSVATTVLKFTMLISVLKKGAWIAFR